MLPLDSQGLSPSHPHPHIVIPCCTFLASSLTSHPSDEDQSVDPQVEEQYTSSKCQKGHESSSPSSSSSLSLIPQTPLFLFFLLPLPFNDIIATCQWANSF